ncbi:MAG TPA: sugar ABC transporter substrate-binding protein [Candidatus Sulfomarinibacteraceae bacterium]|nr:sugar ABC transporter substrate-binding protein [Candidatus Sulfomarinibacteraceae bacterium]
MINRRSGSRTTRWVGLLGSLALVAAACGGGASQAPATEAPATAAPATEAPATEEPAKFKIGYISLGDSVPFVKLVSDSIKRSAEEAGQELAFCDSEIDAAKALSCAQNLKVQGVEGVLNFQVFQDSSPEICEAYGNVPTIAIDIVQPPCEVAFMGANNHEAGRLGGAAIGKYAKDNWNCDITAYVSLESTAAGAANTARMGGWRDGFKEFCPIPADKEHVLDGADRTDPALEAMTNLLGALPGNHIVVVAINEDGILGAIGAANTLGRQTDLYYGGQGTDPSIWKDVACNPNYIVSVAYYPERYGTLLIPNMVKKLQGEEIPREIFTQHEVINRDNIRAIYPETPAC